MADGGRIRVGYYLFSSSLGGTERFVRDLVGGMPRDRVEPVVFLPPWPGLSGFLGLDDDSGVTVRIVDTTEPSVTLTPDSTASSFGTEPDESPLRRWAKRVHVPRRARRAALEALRYRALEPNRRRLAEALAASEVDVLHVVNGGHPGAISALAAVLAPGPSGPPVVLTVCSTAPARGPVAPAARRLDRAVAAAASAVVVPAARPGAALAARGFPIERGRVIPWGVDAPAPVGRSAARAELGWGDDALVVVGLANFTPTKGQAAVVEAAARLRTRVPGLKVVLAGDGPCWADVAAQVSAAGLEDVVTLPGSVARPWALLGAADVFVLASEIEGLPLVVLESLSQGVPVVATDVGGMPEAVVPGVTGRLVPPGRPDRLADDLAGLLLDPTVRREMGRQARVRYEERFTLSAMVGAYERLYQEVAGGRPVPPNT